MIFMRKCFRYLFRCLDHRNLIRKFDNLDNKNSQNRFKNQYNRRNKIEPIYNIFDNRVITICVYFFPFLHLI